MNEKRKTYTELLEICEKIANDRKLPARIVDWADALYSDLVDIRARVSVRALQLLQDYHSDSEYGPHLLDLALARNHR